MDGRMDGRTDGLTDGRTDRRADRRTEGWTDGRTDVRTYVRTDGRTNEWTNGQMLRDRMKYHIYKRFRAVLQLRIVILRPVDPSPRAASDLGLGPSTNPSPPPPPVSRRTKTTRHKAEDDFQVSGRVSFGLRFMAARRHKVHHPDV